MLGVVQGRLSPAPKGMLHYFPEDWKKEFITAKKIGLHAIEWLFYAYEWKTNPILSDAGIQDIFNAEKASGVLVPSICADFFTEYSLVRKHAHDECRMLKTLLTRASFAGMNRVLVPFFGKNAIRNEEDRKNAIENIRNCLPLCERFFVEIAIEAPFGTDELCSFIEEFNNPFVTVCYDVGNRTTAVGAHVPNEIRELNGRIRSMHIKDRKYGSDTSYPLGMGDAELYEIFHACEDIGFTGPFIFETARRDDMDEQTLIGIYLRYIKAMRTKVKLGIHS